MIDVLIVGARWTSAHHSVTHTFADALDRDRFNPRTLACLGSRSIVKAAVVREVHRSVRPLILVGYAQGAAVVGDVASEFGGGGSPIAACALISDPFRPRGHAVGNDPGGYGILGEREIDEVPAYWAAARGDLTTALAPGSSLRMVPELFEYFDLSTDEAVIDWRGRLVDASIREQLARYPAARRLWHSKRGEYFMATASLLTGPHETNYVRLGHVERLAQTINKEIAVHN
ncbi:hypothetical protein [Nocardia sp. NPDC059229]|uniref:hypothetical protein n=1 Tax=Nocardia sp. NPDC059229 TaxID=3346778 RepID=UPI0036C6BD96